jgi:hypothetical protein
MSRRPADAPRAPPKDRAPAPEGGASRHLPERAPAAGTSQATLLHSPPAARRRRDPDDPDDTTRNRLERHPDNPQSLPFFP